MADRRIQRLAAAQIDAALFLELAGHGEDLLVERKAELPEAERLGAEVSSMANMLGGWILLGVEDRTRELVELNMHPGTDLQSHVGNLLRKSVDPVPPFLADVIEVEGVRVGFVRVFQSSTPVLVIGRGAVYSRDAGGKIPISSNRELLDLARRGADAEEEARTRPHRNPQSQNLLGFPVEAHGQPEHSMRTVIRASPLAVTPQLEQWPISQGPKACFWVAHQLAVALGAADDVDVEMRPLGRGVAALADVISPRPFLSYRVVVVADCAGVLGVSMWRQIPNMLATHELRRAFIRPAVDAVAELLTSAEAYGDGSRR